MVGDRGDLTDAIQALEATRDRLAPVVEALGAKVAAIEAEERLTNPLPPRRGAEAPQPPDGDAAAPPARAHEAAGAAVPMQDHSPYLPDWRRRGRRKRYDWALAVELLADGHTMVQVATVLGCSRHSLWRALRRAPALRLAVAQRAGEDATEVGAWLRGHRRTLADALVRAAVEDRRSAVLVHLSKSLGLTDPSYQRPNGAVGPMAHRPAPRPAPRSPSGPAPGPATALPP